MKKSSHIKAFCNLQDFSVQKLKQSIMSAEIGLYLFAFASLASRKALVGEIAAILTLP